MATDAIIHERNAHAGGGTRFVPHMLVSLYVVVRPYVRVQHSAVTPLRRVCWLVPERSTGLFWTTPAPPRSALSFIDG
jgi:hypothetical protein